IYTYLYSLFAIHLFCREREIEYKLYNFNDYFMDCHIEKLVKEGKLQEAILELEKKTADQPDEMDLLELGELYYREGKNTDALNKFNAVLRLNPENSKAQTYISMINKVLDFFCKDLLNP
ncbi:hypothetical protein DXA95_14280, partial [Odoribacter sp. OF09-27XD]